MRTSIGIILGIVLGIATTAIAAPPAPRPVREGGATESAPAPPTPVVAEGEAEEEEDDDGSGGTITAGRAWWLVLAAILMIVAAVLFRWVKGAGILWPTVVLIAGAALTIYPLWGTGWWGGKVIAVLLVVVFGFCMWTKSFRLDDLLLYGGSGLGFLISLASGAVVKAVVDILNKLPLFNITQTDWNFACPAWWAIEIVAVLAMSLGVFSCPRLLDEKQSPTVMKWLICLVPWAILIATA